MSDGNTSDRLPARSDAKRALLEQRLRGGAGTGRGMALTRRRGTAPPPLSFSQQRLWILDQLRPGSPAYNMPVAFRLRGALAVTAMERALNEIVGRHKALRTTFRVIDGEPAQVIAPELTLSLAVEDLSMRGGPEAS